MKEPIEKQNLSDMKTAGVFAYFLQSLVLLLIRSSIAAIFVFPVTYFARGVDGPSAAFVGIFLFGTLVWFATLRGLNLLLWQWIVLHGVVDCVFGLSFGLVMPAWAQPLPTRVGIAYLLFGSAIGSMALGWVVQVINPTGKELKAELGRPPKLSIATVLMYGIVFAMLPIIGNLEQLNQRQKGLAFGSLVTSSFISSKLGAQLGKITRVLAGSGWGIASELRTLGAAGIFFLGGYASLALFYSTVFAAIWRSNNSAFFGDGFPTTPALFDFLYFSVTTIATLGYGDIIPRSRLARVAAMSEVLMGVAWITVVLAATLNRMSAIRSHTRDSTT